MKKPFRLSHGNQAVPTLPPTGQTADSNGTNRWPVLEVIRALTPRQQDALSRICCNDDSCLSPNTAKALQKLGLIDYELKDAGGGLRLYRAEVASIAVHYAWCKWCSEQPLEDDPQ